jgi:ABC-2 type transport system ATP-binding protein
VLTPGTTGKNDVLRASAQVEARGVSRTFGEKVALSDVSLSVDAGEIHALLGPNGAGKTTLVRILTGLLAATSGDVRVAGVEPTRSTRPPRERIGFVPSGDRTLYLRLSGFENLFFFGRLHGLSRSQARARAQEVLAEVDLLDAARVQVSAYSHGMQKRLGFGRALLVEPEVLVVDEATHDLDPQASRRVRRLVEDLARRGTAVVWTTQRLDEIRGFADSVTLLSRGAVRFCGSVPELMAHSLPQHYLLRLQNGGIRGDALLRVLRGALGGRGTVARIGGDASDEFRLHLAEDVVLGDALVAFAAANVDVLRCREEHSEIENAFLTLTESDAS